MIKTTCLKNELKNKAFIAKTILVLAIGLTFTSGSVSAQGFGNGQGGARPEGESMNCTPRENPAHALFRRWDKLDTNHDGFVSKDEYLREASERFDLADTNHDGKLSKEEAETFFMRVKRLKREIDDNAEKEFHRRLKEGN